MQTFVAGIAILEVTFGWQCVRSPKVGVIVRSILQLHCIGYTVAEAIMTERPNNKMKLLHHAVLSALYLSAFDNDNRNWGFRSLIFHEKLVVERLYFRFQACTF